MIILILLKTLFFPLSDDAIFVEIGKIEEEKIEKITPEKLIIILTINKNKNLRPYLHCFKGAKSFIKFTLHLRLPIKAFNRLMFHKIHRLKTKQERHDRQVNAQLMSF